MSGAGTHDETVLDEYYPIVEILDRHDLSSRFEEAEDEGVDDAIEVTLGDKEVGDIQITMDGRFAANVWADPETRANGPIRRTVAEAATDLIGLAEKYNIIAAR